MTTSDDRCELTPEQTPHPIPPPKRRKGGDRDSCSNEDQEGYYHNHKSPQEKTYMQGKCLEVVPKSSKDEVSKYDADQSSECESSDGDKSEVKASDAPPKGESSIEVITFVTLDFQNGYFTVYPTDTANANPTLLTHCPIFLTHIYFI